MFQGVSLRRWWHRFNCVDFNPDTSRFDRLRVFRAALETSDVKNKTDQKIKQKNLDPALVSFLPHLICLSFLFFFITLFYTLTHSVVFIMNRIQSNYCSCRRHSQTNMQHTEPLWSFRSEDEFASLSLEPHDEPVAERPLWPHEYCVLLSFIWQQQQRSNQRYIQWWWWWWYTYVEAVYNTTASLHQEIQPWP